MSVIAHRTPWHAAGRRALLIASLLAAVGVAVPADAYQPVVHEFIPPDDREDLKLAVTTTDGNLPAAIETPSGIVRAPDTQRAPTRDDAAYGPPGAAAAPSPVFKADRDTRRPGVVRYQDPFTPSITPYKRLRAYDSVTPESALRVRDTGLVRVPVGGELRPGEDQFYGDLTVDFAEGASVLIPSVGAGARILRQHTLPPAPLEVWRDGADNWYARSSVKGRIRLVVQLAVARRAFGGPLNMPSRAVLPGVPALPLRLARAVDRVAQVIGVSRASPPAETVDKLVSYFRSFAASEEPPGVEGDIYLDLALSKKGVCRHRAYAFLVTALGMGIPTRMVVNEAHAWVEVRSVDLWQRIDLGGAPAAIDEQVESGRTEYVPPADAFAWPAASDGGSGRQSALRGRRARSSAARRASSSATSSSLDSDRDPSAAGEDDAITQEELTTAAEASGAAGRAGAAGTDTAARGDDTAGTPSSELRGSGNPSTATGSPPAIITLRAGDANVRRGGLLAVAGTVRRTGDDQPCPSVRLDVALRAGSGVPSASTAPTALGVLAAGADGSFAGELVVPWTLPVGEYDVVVTTPASDRCAAGRSH